MIIDPRDIKVPAYLSAFLGIIAITLACIGVGTPSWQNVYSNVPNNTLLTATISFYYACYISNSTCLSGSYSTESYIHLRQASGLAIVGILFLFFGIIGTSLIGIRSSDTSLNIKGSRRYDFHIFFGPLCLFISTITMLAALAEGSETIIYNGYSAKLYQTAHVISIFALLTSAYASGRRTLLAKLPDEILSLKS